MNTDIVLIILGALILIQMTMANVRSKQLMQFANSLIAAMAQANNQTLAERFVDRLTDRVIDEMMNWVGGKWIFYAKRTARKLISNIKLSEVEN